MKVGDIFPDISLRHVYSPDTPFEGSGKEPRRPVREALAGKHTLIAFFPELDSDESSKRLFSLHRLTAEFEGLGVSVLNVCGYNQRGFLWSNCLQRKFPGELHAFLGYDLYNMEETRKGTQASLSTLLVGPDYKVLLKFDDSVNAQGIFRAVGDLVNASPSSKPGISTLLSGSAIAVESPVGVSEGNKPTPRSEEPPAATSEEEPQNTFPAEFALPEAEETESGDSGDRDELPQDADDSY